MDVFEQVARAHRGYFEAAAIHAAWQLNLFAALPGTAEELAAHLGASPHRLAALLDVLELAGVLQHAPDGFRVAVPPPRVEGLPAEGWGQLARVIREDRPLTVPATDYQDHVHHCGEAPAAEVAARLVRSPRRVLDAGGGAGVYTTAILAEHPGAQVTLVDCAEVLELARARLDEPRVTWRARDLLAGDLGRGYDHALLMNVLHFYGPADCRRLLARLAASLAPDGRVVVKDLDPAAATGRLFALNMALYTERGGVWPEAAIGRWLSEAGLGEVRREHLSSSPSSLVFTARLTATAP